ncbi:Histidinol-phosphate aminotransferase [Erysiphe neolycopersici]|uniref:histidinol-phosphate transaminase n=1 Tax=Erysiphe neolycopersici TaxID=212602 RepID=A0A420I4N7_9PEZI|nr:Histidinol-phosphate aminotransferase [Erysiphe neolycopersici]
MAERRSAFDLQTCARKNILSLKPYRCARDDYKDDGRNILLDANENAYGPSIVTQELLGPLENPNKSPVNLAGLHRYPDPYQFEVKQQFCKLRNTHSHTSKDIGPENLFLGVGSDEAIDALIRCFCVPGRDKILICPPTYGMYAVSAQVNDIGIVKVPLLPAPKFDIDLQSVLSTLSSSSYAQIKLIFICSPGNPTGSLIKKSDIQHILEHPTWNGVVVIDEAYVDFAPENSSLAEWVVEWPNLVVMQTLSKAFGLAGIRLGVAFTSSPIATLLNSLKAPYNINSHTSEIALKGLQPAGVNCMKNNRGKIFKQRDRLLDELLKIPGIGGLRGGTASNFLLIEFLDSKGKASNETALKIYQNLAEDKKVVVRFRGTEHGCLGCLRITVGTEEEVTTAINKLKEVLDQIRSSESSSVIHDTAI